MADKSAIEWTEAAEQQRQIDAAIQRKKDEALALHAQWIETFGEDLAAILNIALRFTEPHINPSIRFTIDTAGVRMFHLSADPYMDDCWLIDWDEGSRTEQRHSPERGHGVDPVTARAMDRDWLVRTIGLIDAANRARAGF